MCLCLASVFMICLLLNVRCWSIIVWCMPWSLGKLLLWIWVPLHLGHRCSELRVHLGRFFSFDQYEVSFLTFFDNFWLKVDFIWYYNGYSSLVLWTICFENCFPTFYSEVLSAFFSEVHFMYASKCWVFFTHPVCQCMSFYWKIESIIVKRY